MARDTIQSLWIDNNLSRIERLSIKSFLDAGHGYRLYTYSRGPMDVPDGTEVRDAREIVAEADVWTHRFGPAQGSYAGFSDFFRYSLLMQRGGIWADTDLLCVRPLPEGREIMIGSERFRPGVVKGSTQLLKFPAGDPMVSACLEVCKSLPPETISFSKIGPELISRMVEKFGYERYLLPYVASCAVHWNEHYRNFLPEHGEAVMAELARPEACCLHLWHELLRRQNIDKNAIFPAGTAFERVAARLGDRPEPTGKRLAAGLRFVARMYLVEQADTFRPTTPEADRRLIERALESDPALGTAYLRAVKCPAMAAEAEALLAGAPAETAGQSHFRLALAEWLLSEGRRDEAMAEACRAVDLGLSETAEVLADAIQFQLRNAETAPARESALRGVERFPAAYRMQLLLGRAEKRLGHAAEALAAFRAAHELNPQDPASMISLAEELAEAGALPEALEKARAAAALSEHSRIRMGLVRVLLLAGQKAEALEVLRDLVAADPADRVAATQLAGLLRRRGQDADAAELVEALAAHGPAGTVLPAEAADAASAGDPEAPAEVARALLREGDGEQARARLRAALDSGTETAEMQALLAQAEKQLGNLAAALAAWRRALALDPSDAALRAGLAEDLAEAGDLAEALELARGVLADAEAGAEAPGRRVAMARILIAAGETAEAEAALRQVLQRDPAERPAVLMFAGLLRRTARKPEAAALLRGFLDRVPDDAGARRMLASLN